MSGGKANFNRTAWAVLNAETGAIRCLYERREEAAHHAMELSKAGYPTAVMQHFVLVGIPRGPHREAEVFPRGHLDDLVLPSLAADLGAAKKETHGR